MVHSFSSSVVEVAIQNTSKVVRISIPDESELKTWYETSVKCNNKIVFPYWAKLWPSAIALSSFLLNNTAIIKNKRMLELAAGLGLPSFTIADLVSNIVISDIAPDAVAYLKKQLVHYTLPHISVQQLSWHSVPKNIAVDVVLLSDVNYEPAEFKSLFSTIQILLERKITIVLATPQRIMAKEFILQCLHYCTINTEILVSLNGKEELISILVLQQQIA